MTNILLRDKHSRSFWPLVAGVIFLIGITTGLGLTPGSGQTTDPQRMSYIDTHVHIDGKYRMRLGPGRAPGPMGPPAVGGSAFVSDYDKAAENALATMNSLGIEKSLVMPPPFPPDHPMRHDHEELAEMAKKNPKRFAFLAGGGSLNPMIQESVRSGKLTPDIQSKFEKKASEVLRAGALGFGEMTAEHLSFHADHPYESAPPDHPLFLLLADIAARHDVPIDLHMEAVPQEMPLPPRFNSPPNPTILRENISAFERLLSHNRKARIIWVHAGSDSTGYRTVALMRRLLEAYPNLYMSIKVERVTLVQNRPLDERDEIRPEWVDLIRSFPDRFLIGSDQMYGIPGLTAPRPPFVRGPKAFLDQLPSDLARKVGYENPVRIYKLK